jgi:hypothetical protein
VAVSFIGGRNRVPGNKPPTCRMVKELDPKLSGYYIDSFLRLIFGGIGWQVRFRFLKNKYI